MHSKVLGRHHQKIRAKWQIGGDYDKLPLTGRTQIRLKLNSKSLKEVIVE